VSTNLIQEQQEDSDLVVALVVLAPLAGALRVWRDPSSWEGLGMVSAEKALTAGRLPRVS
jgi:hypothetical protein